jgi:hypothetical protein
MKLFLHRRGSAAVGALVIFTLPPAAQAVPPASPGVRLERAGMKWDEYGQFLTELRLVNGSAQTISFTGGSVPYFIKEFCRPWGWHKQKIDWCGLELEREPRLRPGESWTFTLPPQQNQTWRLRVPYARGPRYASGERGMVCSPALPSFSDAWVESSGAEPAKYVRTSVAPKPGKEGIYSFVLENISAQPVYYSGFNHDSPYDRGPVYLVQEKHGPWWKREIRALCGSGLRFRQIPPGQSLRFDLRAQSGERPWRAGVRVFLKEDPRSLTDVCRPVWWPALPPRP